MASVRKSFEAAYNLGRCPNVPYPQFPRFFSSHVCVLLFDFSFSRSSPSSSLSHSLPLSLSEAPVKNRYDSIYLAPAALQRPIASPFHLPVHITTQQSFYQDFYTRSVRTTVSHLLGARVLFPFDYASQCAHVLPSATEPLRSKTFTQLDQAPTQQSACAHQSVSSAKKRFCQSKVFGFQSLAYAESLRPWKRARQSLPKL